MVKKVLNKTTAEAWGKNPKCIMCGKKLKNANSHMCSSCKRKYE